MKPILFNTKMVRAILGGKKTTTRRCIKGLDSDYEFVGWCTGTTGHNSDIGCAGFSKDDQPPKLYKPKYKIGNILYVKETWQKCYEVDGNDQIVEETGNYAYKASEETIPNFTHWVREDGTYSYVMPWRSSIHMPKEAARLFLRVTDVSVEKLQEGINNSAWVWVYEFEVISKDEAKNS